VPAATPLHPTAIRDTLSVPRSETYLKATGDLDSALALYGWNARVAGMLLVPAHLAEVAVRNAADMALTKVYGYRWPWNSTFERSLPDPARGFSPRRELRTVREHHTTTGKVIADLKFAFWQRLFTSRHDERLWNDQILTLFPNSGLTAPTTLRDRIYGDLEVIRTLRNRVAHHEPVFNRDLQEDLERMLELTKMRCAATGSWVSAMEDVSRMLRDRP